jgi:hypothetical protein
MFSFQMAQRDSVGEPRGLTRQWRCALLAPGCARSRLQPEAYPQPGQTEWLRSALSFARQQRLHPVCAARTPAR